MKADNNMLHISNPTSMASCLIVLQYE